MRGIWEKPLRKKKDLHKRFVTLNSALPCRLVVLYCKWFMSQKILKVCVNLKTSERKTLWKQIKTKWSLVKCVSYHWTNHVQHIRDLLSFVLCWWISSTWLVLLFILCSLLETACWPEVACSFLLKITKTMVKCPPLPLLCNGLWNGSQWM